MRFYFCFSLLFIFNIVFGQNISKCDIDVSAENIFVHTDRDRYIVGETIWFKAYCIKDNKLNSEISKVLYVEFFDCKNNSYVSKKFRIDNGLCYGDFTIPMNLTTGNYFLRAYTKFQRSFSKELYFTQVISVLNPLKKAKSIEQYDSLKEITSIVEKYDTVEKNKFEKLILKTDKSVYHKRELVSLNIQGSVPKDINLSISVRAMNSGFENHMVESIVKKNQVLEKFVSFSYPEYSDSIYYVKQKKLLHSIDELNFIPDFRDLTLNGKIVGKESKAPIKNLEVVSALVGNNPQIHINSTKEDGRFIMVFNDLVGQKKLFIGTKEDKMSEDIEILVSSDFDSEYPDLNPVAIEYDSLLNSFYSEIYTNFQIQNRFDVSCKINSQQEKTFPFINIKKPDFTVTLKEFIDLPDMTNVFRELVKGVYLGGDRAERYLSIYNKESGSMLNRPLVLLDNVPVFNTEKILLLDPSTIKDISVYYSKYFLGNFSVNGIVSINTINGDYSSYKWEENSAFISYDGVSLADKFSSPIYSEEVEKSIPDFRTTLYWNPMIDLKNINNIEFYTSDYCTTYEIVIKGFDQSGRAYNGYTQIRVVD